MNVTTLQIQCLKSTRGGWPGIILVHGSKVRLLSNVDALLLQLQCLEGTLLATVGGGGGARVFAVGGCNKFGARPKWCFSIFKLGSGSPLGVQEILRPCS